MQFSKYFSKFGCLINFILLLLLASNAAYAADIQYEVPGIPVYPLPDEQAQSITKYIDLEGLDNPPYAQLVLLFRALSHDMLVGLDFNVKKLADIVTAIKAMQDKLDDTITNKSKNIMDKMDQNTTKTITAMGVDFSNLIAYIQAAISRKNALDASLLYEEAPGGNTTALTTAVDLTGVLGHLPKTVNEKEVNDHNFSLYLMNPPGATPPGDPYLDFFEKHKKYYCSPNSVVETQGFADSCDASNDILMQHADLKISSLLRPLGYSPADRVLASEVIKNLVVPFPSYWLRQVLTDPKKKDLKKYSTKRRLAETWAVHASFSAARNSFNQMFADRIKLKADGSDSNSLDSGDAKFKKSVMEMMSDEALRRFGNKDWYAKVAGASDSALLRELAHMEAFRLWLEYKKYEQNERMEAVLATTLASLLQMRQMFTDMMPDSVLNKMR